MVNEILKRTLRQMLIATILVVFVCVFFVPNAQAAGQTVTGWKNTEIGLLADGGAWKATSTDSVQGSVTGTGGCTSSAGTTTLTITNQKSAEAKLTFDYAAVINGGSIQIDGASQSAATGVFEKNIQAGETVQIILTSAAGEKTSELTLSNIHLTADTSPNMTFAKPENGSYSVDGTAITEEAHYNKNALIGYQLSATADEGYKFLGWYVDGAFLSDQSNYTLKKDTDATICAKFVSESSPVLGVGMAKYTDWQEAINAANTGSDKVVTVLEDCVMTEDCTIPSGVTLLVPFDDLNTCFADEKPTPVTTPSTRAEYRKLTIEGVLTVEAGGKVSVGATHCSSQSYGIGSVGGKYGHLELAPSGKINLEDGAELFAYGYITGEGIVEADSGSQVYEYFQIIDWRGGSCSSAMLNNETKVFFFSQYYVQNIEARLRLHAGATENVVTSVTASFVGTTSAKVPFVGEGGLFGLNNGYLEKWYDDAEDRLHIDFYGDANLNSISMEVGVSISSAQYVLPITNNISVGIKQGTFTLKEEASLLPGVEVIIDEGATLETGSGKALFVYDRDDWVGKKFVYSNASFRPSPYVVSRTKNRSENDLVDVKLDVNGAMIVNGGLYTTKGSSTDEAVDGPNITSSKETGTILLHAAADESRKLYEVQQNNTTPNYIEIPVSSAVLRNNDGTYTETAGMKESTLYEFVDGSWREAETTAPVASIDPGIYMQNQEVVLTSETEDANIYYTLDGTTPTKDSALYQGPISVSGEEGKEIQTTIRAIAVKDYQKSSPVVDFTYCIHIHQWVEEWTSDETAHWHECITEGSHCSATANENKDGYSKHTEAVDAEVAATCTESGKTEGKHCSVCDTVLVAQEEVAALGHTEVVDAEVAATCTEAGKTEGKHCGVCDTVFVEQEVIPALGHTYENGTCKNCGEKEPVKPLPPSGGGSVLPPAGNQEIVTNTADKETPYTTANIGITVENDAKGNPVATTVVSESIGKEIVEKAVLNHSVEIVIQAKAENPSTSGDVKTSQVTLLQTTAKAIAAMDDISMTVQTAQGDLNFDAKALDSIVRQAEGDTIEIIVEEVQERTATQEEAVGESGVVYELKVVHSNGTISDFEGGNVEVSLLIPDQLKGKTLKLLYIDDDGYYAEVPGKQATVSKKAHYIFRTVHFSSYALLEASEADVLLEQQEKDIAKLKAGVEGSTIKLRSKLTKTGKIRLEWSKSKGYKVDYYEVFRSVKKNKGYGKKAFFSTKDGAKKFYINTKELKKGTRYYYKVRGVRVVAGEKVYTKWSNKAWRMVK